MTDVAVVPVVAHHGDGRAAVKAERGVSAVDRAADLAGYVLAADEVDVVAKTFTLESSNSLGVSAVGGVQSGVCRVALDREPLLL